MKTVSIAPKIEILVCSLNDWGRRTGVKYLVELGLCMIEGNTDSYFTFPNQPSDKSVLLQFLSEDQYNQAKALIKPLHLSDSRGIPLHAIDNGFYFIQIAQGVAKYHEKSAGDKEKYTKILADHLRCDYLTAQDLVDNVENKDVFETIIKESFLMHWENEAQTAIEFLHSIEHLSQK